MAESADELFIRRFFESRSLRVSRLPEETRDGIKQPDYQVHDDSTGRDFCCELKSVATDTSCRSLSWSQIYNRLTKDIRHAAKQFCAVNPNHLKPNVLAWISHDIRLNVHTFLDLVKGDLRLGRHQIADFTRYIAGRVRGVFNDVDMHIWLENDGTPQFVLNGVHRHHTEALAQLFRLGPLPPPQRLLAAVAGWAAVAALVITVAVFVWWIFK